MVRVDPNGDLVSRGGGSSKGKPLWEFEKYSSFAKKEDRKGKRMGEKRVNPQNINIIELLGKLYGSRRTGWGVLGKRASILERGFSSVEGKGEDRKIVKGPQSSIQTRVERREGTWSSSGARNTARGKMGIRGKISAG